MDVLDNSIPMSRKPNCQKTLYSIQRFENIDTMMHNSNEGTNFWTTVHRLTTYIANFAYFQHLRVECFSIQMLAWLLGKIHCVTEGGCVCV